MKTIYLECNMGAAGDMLAAALLELHPDRQGFIKRLNALGLPGVRFEAERSVKCGITGTHMLITVNGVEEESYDEHTHDHEHYGCEHSHEHHEHHGCENGYEHQEHHDYEHHGCEHSHGHHEHHACEHSHEHHGCENGHEHEEHHDHEHSHEHHEHYDCEHRHEHDCCECAEGYSKDHCDEDYGHHHEHEYDHGSCGYSHEHGEHYHEYEHHHAHYGLKDIEHTVSHLDLPDKVRSDVLSVYRLIAEAESHAHGRPVEEIHFHEVGSLDAVADITAVCLLINELAPDRIIASPIHVGCGQVRCAHGMLPVPAPATAWILKDVPTYGGEVRGELCTPTGAALIKHFAHEFGAQPAMRIRNIGYGCGKKDFEWANCIRAMLGETTTNRDSVVELCCNLDDMTPEAVGFAMERLFEAGALDVYTLPAGMKKNRPGILLTCICRHEQRDEMVKTMFMHTTTLGIRENECNRYILDRKVETLCTKYGSVRVKTAEGWGVKREKIEYDDLAAVARKYGISLAEAEGCAAE